MPPFRKRRADPAPDPHDMEHARLKAEVNKLFGLVAALDARLEDAASEARAMRRAISALEDKNRAVMSRLAALPPAPAVPEAPEDGNPPEAVTPPKARGTSRSKTAAAKESGTA